MQEYVMQFLLMTFMKICSTLNKVAKLKNGGGKRLFWLLPFLVYLGWESSSSEPSLIP